MVYLEHVTRYIWNMEQGISGTWNMVYLEHVAWYICNLDQEGIVIFIHFTSS